ncbi:hypothetical protein [Dongshaea marina]|uniref:hypothetical protein n=1 Tax=Dongshaea marina TaxID=2047966 RepID=UPI001F426B98|nr:hypothetical protein [Dongshaea marina]
MANVWFSQTRQNRREKLDDQIPLEVPHVLEESLIILKDHLGITFDMISEKIGMQPEFLAEILCIKYISDDSDEADNVVIPFNF